MDSTWKPHTGIAVALGILLPPFTFLYINKAKLFWFYLLANIGLSFLDWKIGGYYSVALNLICPIHAYFIVKSYDLSLQRAWYSKAWAIPAILVSIIVPMILVRSFLYEPFSIPASSMSPSINVGDHVIVRKLGFGTYGTYGFTLLGTDLPETQKLDRGKIYVFYPPHKKTPFVKRLVALPGDTIEVQDGKILLNGQVVSEQLMSTQGSKKILQEKLDNNTYSIMKMLDKPTLNFRQAQVPEGHYFFMGDNRNNSSDSRDWGFVSSNNIIGEVVYIFHSS